MSTNFIKRYIRNTLRTKGYSIRDMGTGVQGVDLLHDARLLLHNAPAAIFFDVGANIGQTTQAMLDNFEAPNIYAFEPSPSTVETLRKNVGNQSGVTIEAVAIGEKNGTIPFHVTQDYSVNDSILAPTWDAGGKVVEVSVDTIDHYCDSNSIESISLLKIDAQGYDLQVLMGARQMLEKRRIKLYCCEANMDDMYKDQTNLIDLLSFAKEVGYKLCGFYEQTYIKNELSFLDILFSAE